MRSILTGKTLVFGIFAGITGLAAALAACSGTSSSVSNGNNLGNGSSSGTSPGGQGNTNGVSNQPGSCANPTVQIVFSPMYSAFVAGSTAQTFSLPAVTADGNSATWSLSDPTQANLAAQSFMVGGVNQPGVMLTLAGTGDSNGNITVFATESNGACGSAVLHVTENQEGDWDIGNARYNDGVSLVRRPRDGGASEGGGGRGGVGDDAGSYYETDGGTACTNCHGPTATAGPFKDVSHTPEQTAGFSDQDLANIILNGEVPDGGYFDPTVLKPTCDGSAECTQSAYNEWHAFHRWTDIDPQMQLPGVICYLRSLTPEAQNGTSNFGGHHHRDGGTPPQPPVDAGSDEASDAGTGAD